MAKTKTPFFSMGAQGSVGGSMTAQKLASSTLLRGKPLPTDPYSLPQAYQRWLYEDYAYLWTKQTDATKAEYRTAGLRFHLTGFQYWMKYQLTNMPDIAGIWHLDEKGGAIAYDSSPNQNHGTIIGASPTTLRINGATSFDGINDIIWVPNAPSLNFGTGDFTIETFMQGTDPSAYRVIAHKWATAQPYYYLLCQITTGQLRARLNGVSVFSTFNVLDGVLRHVACTRSGDTLSLYIAGLFHNSSPGAAAISASNTNQLAIGNNSAFPATNYPFKGPLDHLGIYNRALDPTEILRHSLRRYPPE